MTSGGLAAGSVPAQHARMSKRVLGSLLWFMAMWIAYEIVWSIAGVPRLYGPIIAASVSSFVAIDPRGRFWSQARASRPNVEPLGVSRLTS
jgi:hypothetical protein